jgi:ATP-binding cassette subfamily F protein 3
MLSINNLSIRFSDKHLFRDVSTVVYGHDRIGLIGVNGAGKSTLMRIMAGETATDDGVVSRSRFFTVGYLAQEPGVLNSATTLYAEAEGSFGDVLGLQKELESINSVLAEGAEGEHELDELLARQGELQHRLEAADVFTIRARVEKVLYGLGFSQADLNAPVRSFSGGWIMRLELAKMLLAAPSLLLLDEPTNHLDLDSLTWLESYLDSYHGAMVVISHDRSFLDRITTHTWELSMGRLSSYKGNYSYYLGEKEERRRIEKASYDNQQAKIRQTMRFVERFRAKSTKARQAQSKLKQLDRMELIELAEDERHVNFAFPPAPHCGRDVLMAENLSKHFSKKQVFSHVSLHLQRGDKVAVVGVNGAGKSTLVKILAGQLDPSGGARRFGAGVRLTYFGQHQAQELSPQFTVFETLSQAVEDMTITRIRSLLGAFLFSGTAVDKKVAVLSGGEKSRLALARMIATPANCMVLDEPTNHLDMSSQEVLQEAMRQYDGTIIVVSHNRYFLDCFVNKVIEVKNGAVTVYPGTVAEYLQRCRERDQLETDADIAAQSDTGASSSGRDGKKEQRRQKAELRRRRTELAGTLLRKLAEAEKKVARLEERKKELETVMADPGLYQDEQRWKETSADYEQCSRRLDRWLGRWEEAQSKIDGIDAELGYTPDQTDG